MNSLQPVHIILADDDADDRYIFETNLKETRIPTSLNMFKNGKELLFFLQDLGDNPMPDIVFLDMNMPIMDGLECLKKIREIPRYRELTIAIYSTSSAVKDRDNTYMAGANIYITKPQDPDLLVDVLKKVL